MNYNGWDKEYLENKNAYSDLFHKVMQEDNDRSVEFLEERIAEYSGRSYAVAVNSATDALYYSLLCYGIGPSDEVLVSDFSWISSASCITMAGATPVFCDIDLDSFAAHKTFCDTLISHTDKNGATVSAKRYTTNGGLNTNDTRDLNISDLVVCSQAIFGYHLGKFQVISERRKEVNSKYRGR